MSGTTPRLALPLISAGQAQKEMTHNEALARLDLALQASVIAVGADEPPVDPAPGDCWIVGSAPVGAWAGRADAIAGWTEGGWRFVAARDGMTAWATDAGVMLRFATGTWSRAVLAAPSAAIGAPTGGAVTDAQARSAIVAILAALERHGLVAPDL